MRKMLHKIAFNILCLHVDHNEEFTDELNEIFRGKQYSLTRTKNDTMDARRKTLKDQLLGGEHKSHIENGGVYEDSSPIEYFVIQLHPSHHRNFKSIGYGEFRILSTESELAGCVIANMYDDSKKLKVSNAGEIRYTDYTTYNASVYSAGDMYAIDTEYFKSRNLWYVDYTPEDLVAVEWSEDDLVPEPGTFDVEDNVGAVSRMKSALSKIGQKFI